MAIRRAAQLCVSGVVACVVGSFGAGCAGELDDDSDDAEATATVADALAVDTAIYANSAPTAPWKNWSWSSNVAFANTEAPLLSGSKSHIKATVKAAWGALSLAHASADLATADYEAVTFDIRGTAGASVVLFVETLAGAGSGASQTVPVTAAWKTVTVSLRALEGSLASFGKVNFASPKAGQTFYIDNVKLVPRTAPPVAATPAPKSATFPVEPLTVTKNSVVTLQSTASPYFLFVPTAYDASHAKPTKLFVWLHGCGGDGKWDAQVVSPGGAQSWLTISVGGRDGKCWNTKTDSALVFAAIDDVQRRLNVDPRRVVIGGYSSGGDLAYRTAFYNARRFAGVLAENTAPFYGTGSTQSASIAAAAWKLNIVHLAHTGDTTYPIAMVRRETDALKAAGFASALLERAGGHYDADTASAGTNYDLRKILLPYLDAGWVAPE